MQKSSLPEAKTSLKAKIALVVFGLFLFLILLEAGSRIGGFVLLSMQDYKNKKSMQQKGAYRIMCLGESTTWRKYPALLEKILNQRHTAIRFSVIDKGRDGTTTTAIVEQLNSDLDKYRPDMVITMMGVNDKGAHIPYEAPTTSKKKLFLRSLKTYKLARLLCLHILAKARERGLCNLKEDNYAESSFVDDSFKIALEKDPKDTKAWLELGRFYREKGRFLEAEEAFKKGMELCPEDDREYFESNRFYQDPDKLARVEAALKKALEVSPGDYYVYMGLGRVYREGGKYLEAEEAYGKAIESHPENGNAYYELGWVYQDEGKFPEAEDIFKKAIAMCLENDRAYYELGFLYQNQRKFSQAEETFKKAIVLYPDSDRAYRGLGRLYQEKGPSTFSQAEEAFKKAIDLNPENERTYHAVAWLYRFQGKFLEAEDALKKAIELNPKSLELRLELGRFYREEGKFQQAEATFKKALDDTPHENDSYGALSVLYEEMGKPQLAQEYAIKANRGRLGHYNLVTVNNYRKLKDILDTRGIKLVCVQYPMRNIASLKKIFEGNEKGITFISNERVFRDAVKKEGTIVYFRDMFGGDFGHCTEKGNRLLAGNIASAILKEVFNQ